MHTLEEMALFDEKKIKGHTVQHFRGVSPQGNNVSHIVAIHPKTGKKTTLYHGPTEGAPAMTESIQLVPFDIDVKKNGLLEYQYTISLFDEVLIEGIALTENAANEQAAKITADLQEKYVTSVSTKKNAIDIAKSYAKRTNKY